MPVDYGRLCIEASERDDFRGLNFRRLHAFLGPCPELSGETPIASGSPFMYKNFGLLF